MACLNMMNKFLLLSATFFMALALSCAFAISVLQSDTLDTTGVTVSAGSLLYSGMHDDGYQSKAEADDITFVEQESGSTILEPVADELDPEVFIRSMVWDHENIVDEFLAPDRLAILAWEAGEGQAQAVSQPSHPSQSTSASTVMRRGINEPCRWVRIDSSRKRRSPWEETCLNGGSIGSGAGRDAGGGVPSSGMRPRSHPDSNRGGGAGGGTGEGSDPRGSGVPGNESSNGSSRNAEGTPDHPSDPGDTGGNTGSTPPQGDNGGNPGWGTGGDWDEAGNGEGVPPSEIVEIPEPPTLVLLVLGFAALCLAGGCKVEPARSGSLACLHEAE